MPLKLYNSGGYWKIVLAIVKEAIAVLDFTCWYHRLA
jgi:hypothetical protein